MIEHQAVICWVLDRTRQQLLLVEHRHFGWSCPGGHVEPGETLTAAAARELVEETGVVAVPLGAAFLVDRNDRCPRQPGAYDVLHHFRFEFDSTKRLVSEAGQPARWFALDALPEPRIADVDVVLATLRG